MPGKGSAETILFESDGDIYKILEQAFEPFQIPQGKRVLVLIPDGTRTAPIARMVDILRRVMFGGAFGGAKVLDFLIALGTHQPMTPEQIEKLVGFKVADVDSRIHVY